MTRIQTITLAAGGSFALLAGAFLFQSLGFPPCEMCLWQRWPHAAAILIGALAIVWRPTTVLCWLGALAALATGGLGIYHTGVERGWWEGPSSCTGDGLGGATDLLSTDIAPIVMCDNVSWSLFGLSMASYNAIFSILFVLLWIKAARS